MNKNKFKLYDKPFFHFIYDNFFKESILHPILKLNIPTCQKNNGVRTITNNSRIFLNNKVCKKYPEFKPVLDIFESDEIKNTFFKLKNRDPKKYPNLRLEYVLDIGDFYIKIHTDLEVKGISLLVYISPDGDEKTWGTDLYDVNKQKSIKIPYRYNSLNGFFPCKEKNGIPTYHGVEPVKINGIRKVFIINYVSDEWIDKYELSDYDYSYYNDSFEIIKL